MCICKILRLISRAILGTLVALLLAGLVFAMSQTTLMDWIMLATVLVIGTAFSCAIIGLVHLARQRCDGDR